jgi:hypothetical protein
MSKRFERLGAKVETMLIAAVLVVIAIAYVVSRFTGGSAN